MHSSKMIRSLIVGSVLGLGAWQGAIAAPCTISGNGECTLQGKLDEFFGSHANAPDTVINRVPENLDAAWKLVGNVGTSAMLFEIAGFAGANTFGLYDVNAPGVK